MADLTMCPPGPGGHAGRRLLPTRDRKVPGARTTDHRLWRQRDPARTTSGRTSMRSPISWSSGTPRRRNAGCRP